MPRTGFPSASALLLSGIFAAPAASADLAQCASIPADLDRLACYDRIVAEQRNAVPEIRGADADAIAYPDSATAPADDNAGAAAEPASNLAQLWELDAATRRGLFRVRTHYPTYLIGAYSTAPNSAPYRPFRTLAPEAADLSNLELAFQLSFKLKFAEQPFNAPLDLWFGYTQRSFWQAANQKASSPFRATDYRPEVMAVFPTDLHVMGLRLRFVNLGLVHESNGQASTLSRSWNRAYAQAGFERDNFTLLARAWKRFDEPASTDDNPDIVDYMGRGDLLATYRWNRHELSLMTRYNFKTKKGAAQLGWSFPLSSRARKLKGYVQLFSGYGHTLIDYNHFQHVLGVGFVITD